MKHLGALGLVLITALVVGCSTIRTDCTIGVVGTSATITIQGWGAGQVCQDILVNPQISLGTTAPKDPRSYFELSQAPIQPVICEYSVSERRYIVRDEGALKLVGNLLCASIQARAR